MVAEFIFNWESGEYQRVSTDCLRYYEAWVLIVPKKVSDGSGYRYDRDFVVGSVIKILQANWLGFKENKRTDF